MNNKPTMRRVRRPKEQEDQYKALSQGEDALFVTFKDIFMMSAAIGYYFEQCLPFEQTAEQIQWHIFKEQDRGIIDIIALDSSENNFDILTDDKLSERLSIVEEFANSGFKILEDRLTSGLGDPLDNLVSLIFEVAGSEDTKKDPINDILHMLG